ncbi:diguanylate cyclase [Alteromonas sp. CYL-A6]|uniref:diguanylate cyclase n=1 Tax=Alteromonas nitratireducens TaxID=3390813 RepID=UPI0034B77DAF
MNKQDIALIESRQYLTVRDPSKYMTWTYVVSLSVIALLSFGVHFMLDEVIQQQDKSGHLINISGQQRMLSQRVSLFTLEYLQTGNPKARQTAEAALTRMRQNNTVLLGNLTTLEGKDPLLYSSLSDLYYSPPMNIQMHIARFTALIDEALSIKEEDYNTHNYYTDEFVQLSKTALLDGFNEVVKLYENASNNRVTELKQAQRIVLAIIILTILAEALFIFRPMVKRISEYAARLQYEANYDVLTDLLNRRAFNGVATTLLSSNRRYQHGLSLVLFDIDHFKQLNDTHGHDAGDKAIQWVASVLKEQSRESDWAARIGGEEFALLLSHTHKSGARQAAEKVRHYIASHSSGALSGIAITVSAGISEASPNDSSIDAVMKRADNALYHAKHAGRNCVSDDSGNLTG